MSKKPAAKAEGTGSPGPQSTKDGQSSINPSSIPTGNMIGDDLISRSGNSGSTAATGTSNSAKDTGTTSSTKEEPSTNTNVADPDSWTKDSALKEMKKLRDENRITRLKYEESVEKMKADTDARLAARDAELQKLADAQKELEELKQKEADKKRTLEDKLAHREALLAEFKAQQEMKERQIAGKLSTYETEIQKYRADQEAQAEVHKRRLDAELAKVPEKFKDLASLIVKGAGDSRDALIALSEAQLKGVFDDKTSIVNHSVPGANDGARLDQKKLDEAKNEARAKMKPEDKIRAALKDIRSGMPNSAFRSNK